ncbi:MAG: DUF4214 domain-containing protein, partial [Desulfobacterales bacterium]|nr:DUF4214 domain-containing protein [Desulfobacterales bacterium]
MRIKPNHFILLFLCLFYVFMPNLGNTSVLTSNEDFVEQQYRDFLNREPDDGSSSWISLLDTGNLSRAEIVNSFYDSGEFQNNISPVVRLYFAYFNTILAYADLQTRIAEYQSQKSLNSISDALSASDEFTSTYGSLSNDQFVSQVYQNVLKRLASQEEINSWVSPLASGMTRSQLMMSFSESDEYKTKIQTTLQITMMYISMLRRSPDQSGLNFWVSKLASGASILNLINSFLDSDEYKKRFSETTIISWYLDADGDGYSNGTTLKSMSRPNSTYYTAERLKATSGDCNDQNADINPGQAEVCGDNKDQDCDRQIDEGCGNANIFGVVIGNNGPVSGATIEVYNASDELIKKQEKATDSSGSFNFSVYTLQTTSSRELFVKASGGLSVGDGTPFDDEIGAIYFENQGQCNITPLTAIAYVLGAQTLSPSKIDIDTFFKDYLGIVDWENTTDASITNLAAYSDYSLLSFQTIAINTVNDLSDS